MQFESPASRQAYLYMLMAIMLAAGACNVLLKDFMVMHDAPFGTHGLMKEFDQPILWSLIMKAGMALCLPFCCQRPKAPIGVFFLSCSLGFVTDVLINSAYNSLAGSAIQMLRGGKVLFTALLSMAFLGRQMKLYQIVGASVVISGITLVGISTYLNPVERAMEMHEAERQQKHWRAIGYCIAGELTQACLWVYQESVLKKYDIPPLQLVGLEGLIGIFMAGAAVLAAHVCRIENVTESVYQVTHSLPLLIAVCAMLVTMALFNFAGVGVSKHGSAVSRSVIDVSRSAVIWVVELFLAWHSYSLTQLCGFVILVMGAFLYNRIVVVPTLEKDYESPLMPCVKKQQQTTV